MIILVALLILSPVYYVLKDSDELSGSFNYENSLSKNDYFSQSFTTTFGYGKWYAGFSGTQSEDNSDDSQTNQYVFYTGRQFTDVITFGGSYKRTNEPSQIKGVGYTADLSLNLHKIWDSQYYTTMSVSYSELTNQSDVVSVNGTTEVTTNNKFQQRSYTIGLEQDLSFDLSIGASYTRYTYDDDSIVIVSATAFFLSQSIDGISGYPQSYQSYYFTFYPFENWDFNYSHNISLSDDTDDSRTDDIRLGYTFNSSYKLTGIYSKLKTSSTQSFYGFGLAVYF